MMSDSVDGPSVDNELFLARLLESVNGGHDSESQAVDLLAHLSAEQLEEYKQARECLQLLQLACFEEGEETQVKAGGVTEPIAAVDRAFSIPDRLGRFEVIRQLGVGGFGIVVLARDTDLERNVALKIPKTETLIQSEHRKRFEREAKAAAMLSHPQIVPIHETGRLGPVFYIAYAWVDGPTMAEWLSQRQRQNSQLSNKPVGLEGAIAARMVAALADAVQHAHSRGVLHRDLKPGNVMIDLGNCDPSLDSTESAVELAAALRITDFGLAALDNNEDGLTKKGALMGTPAYMAPEQINGDAASSTAVDIYSLGVILFELLTGRLPWQSNNSLELMNEIVNKPAASPCNFNRRIHRDLSAITLKCLEKDPSSRYRTASELGDDLRRFIDGLPVRARRRTIVQRFLLWTRRNPLIALLTSLLFISLVIGLVSTADQYAKSQRHLRQTQSSFVQAKQAVDDLFASAMSPDLETMPRVRKNMLNRALNYYQEFISQRETDPDLRWELFVAYRRVAAIAADMGDTEDALKHYRLAAHVFEKHFNQEAEADIQLEQFNNLIDIGLQYNQLRKLDDSLDAYDLALEFGLRLAKDEPTNPEIQASLARAYKNKGYVLFEQREIEEAGRHYQRSFNIRKTLVDQFPNNDEYLSRLAYSHSSFSSWYLFQSQFELGLENAEQYRAIMQRLVAEHPENLKHKIHCANAENKVSDVWRLNRDQKNWFPQALKHSQTALELQIALVAEYPLHAGVRRHLVNTYLNLGDVYWFNDDIKASLEQYERAVDVIENGHRLSGIVDDVLLLEKLAILHMRIGDRNRQLRLRRKAMHHYSESQILNERLAAVSDELQHQRRIQRILVLQGKVEMELGNRTSAKEYFRQHLEVGGDHVDARLILAHLLIFAENSDRDLIRAVELCRWVLEDHPNSTNARAHIGAALFHQGKYSEAIEILDEATQLSRRKRYESFVRAMCWSRLDDERRAKEEFKIANDWFEQNEHRASSRNVFLSMQQAANAVLSE